VSAEAATETVVLTPIHGGAKWKLRLEEDVLSLHADDGRVVMMLPKEDAASHIEFAWRIPYGRTVSFVVVAGLRSYVFRSSPAIQEMLLDWLPVHSRAHMNRELRQHGAAMVLIGFLMHLAGLWPFAALTQALGVLNLYAPRALLYFVNGAALGLLGLGCLYLSIAPDTFDVPPMTTTGFGSVLLLWGILQASLASPQHRIEQTRRVDGAAPLLSAESKFPAVMAALCLPPALGLGVLLYRSQGEQFTMLFYGALLAVTVGMAVLIFARGRYSYRELHVGGQWLVVITYFLVYGVAWSMWVEPEYEAGYPPAILLAFPSVYVWAPLILVVVIFNAGFRTLMSRAIAADQGE